MKLVYKETGKEVEIGDVVEVAHGQKVEVTFFRKPHKSSSSGKVNVRYLENDGTMEYFVSVIGAEWIEREDQGWDQAAADKLVAEVEQVVDAMIISATVTYKFQTTSDEVHQQFAETDKYELIDSDGFRDSFHASITSAQDRVREVVEEALGLSGGVALGAVQISTE